MTTDAREFAPKAKSKNASLILLIVRQQGALVRRFLRRVVFAHGFHQWFLLVGLAVVRQRIAELSPRRTGAAIDPMKGVLRIAQLGIGEKRRRRGNARCSLDHLQFQSGLFGCGLHASFEVLANADAAKPSGHSPGRDSVRIPIPADSAFRAIHA
ncbi:MAG: hypothetical protein ABI222_17675 [Opitutaceae bacterium]